MKQNLITLKIKYSCKDSLLEAIRQYNSVLRFTYNRLLENPKMKTAEIGLLQKSVNNCDLIKSHLKNSAVYDARSLVEKSTKPIVFGGKYLFKQRCRLKIGRDEFLLKRLRPLTSIGEANNKANRLFRIIDSKTIQFSLDRKTKFILDLQSVGSKRKRELNKLIELQNTKQVPITYKLDLNYIYLTFDYNLIKTYSYNVRQNRVFAIDMNPNSIGWSVVDWISESEYRIVQSGTFSLKPLNDYRDSFSIASNSDLHKYVTNKRRHEVIEIAKQLFSLCKHYKCEVFSVENLNIKPLDSKKGKRFNKLVNNQWNRNLLVQQVKKHINSSSTTLTEVQPPYNSYIGNLVFREKQLPDECLASIEIGRRGYEFATQFIFKRRSQQKTVIFPKIELVKNQLSLSLEELGVDVPSLDNWKNILSEVKKSKVKYRFSSSDARKIHAEELFSKFYKRKYLIVYEYL